MVKTRVFIIIIAAIGAICLTLSLIFFLPKKTAAVAKVYCENELVFSVDLQNVTSPFEKTIQTPYGYNVISVEHGKIQITDADCPDKLCVTSGSLTGGNVPLVCLPHKLYIVIEGAENSADVVVG